MQPASICFGEEGRKIFDEHQIERMLSGDEAAFRHFVEEYRTYLYQVVYSVLHHQKDAEDVTQEVFVQIYLSLRQYRSQGFKTWITRIAVNKAIDWKRKAQRRKEELMELPEPVQSVQTVENNPEAPYLQKERNEQIRNKLNELPSGQRRAVYAYYFEEKSYKEIASEEGVAEKSVESKLYRAKQWIKKNWEEEER